MKTIIKRLYRIIIPFKLRKEIWIIRNREKKTVYGNLNKKKKFYVINKLGGSHWSIFSTVLNYISSVQYAESKGYIPIVDLTNCESGSFQDKEKIGQENPWEYYFKEPYDYTLDEVYQSKNVYFSRGLEYIDRYRVHVHYRWDIDNILYNNCRRILLKYFKFSDEVMDFTVKQRSLLFRNGEKVMGVEYRREFERGEKLGFGLYNNHPRQLSLLKIFERIEDYMKKWNYKFFFFSVDDSEAALEAKKRFGDSCILLDRARSVWYYNGEPIDDGDVLIRKEHNREDDVRLSGIEYIAEVVLLSECNALVGSSCSASTVAYLLNGRKYEHVDIYDGGMIKIE